MSETDITHGVLYTREEHGSIYDNYWKEEEKRYKKELERQEKMNILLSMSKEELEVLKEIATNRINLKEEIKNLEDDLTLHEETSFEFQEENQRLRKMIRVLTDEILDLTEDCERYCRYKDADKCSTMVCPDCIIKWAENKVKKEMEENKNDKD